MLTAILLLAFTILCILLSGDRAWDNVTKPERNALVFDGRNRAYGAFQLRREYDRRFILAFVGALGIGGLAVVTTKLATMFADGTIPSFSPRDVIDVTFTDDPPSAPVTLPTPTPPTPASTTPSISDVIIVDTTAMVHDTSTAPPIVPGPLRPDTAGSGTPPLGGGSGAPGLTGLTGPPDTLEIGWLEERPEFPGGDIAMRQFVNDHVRFPDEAFGAERVYVGFVVDADGTVTVVKARNGKNPQLIREAERVVRAMPRWQPGKLNGRAVACRLVLPIAFSSR